MTFDCQTNMKQTDSLKVTSSEFAQFFVYRCNYMKTTKPVSDMDCKQNDHWELSEQTHETKYVHVY